MVLAETLRVVDRWLKATVIKGSVILLILTLVIGYSNQEEQRDEDWLLPYSGDHYDKHRTHRHVRSCQPVLHGNVTHEIFRVPEIKFLENFETQIFAHDYVDKDNHKGTALGHISFISDPLRTFSVLEPLHAGSCYPWFAPRGTVQDSGKRKKCIIASNAGYFRTSSGGCIGNIFSDGKLVQTSNGIQNANFGIRRDGSIVTGYLSDDEVKSRDNPFVQLVSGVGWLLRNGEVYTNVSKKSECANAEETGSIEKFFGVLSARTAVGHDRFGRIAVVQVDGKTNQRGINLYTFAELLKSFGLVNAINLDGGGSTTLTVNGTVVNYPSDHCGEDFTCPRKVSTILCLHEPECTPFPNCSGHGVCEMGICRCNGNWSGEGCNITDHIQVEGSTLVMNDETNKEEEEKSMGTPIAWSIGLSALLATSLIANVCLLNLYMASSWREKNGLRTKEDLQRLLVSENDDL